MANDIQDRIGQILGSDSARSLAGSAVTEALKAFGGQRSDNGDGGDSNGKKLPGKGLSGMRGLAAGAGAAAVAPVAAKGIGKLIKGNGVSALAGGPKKLAEEATSKLGDTVEGKLKDKVEDAGGASGILKDTVKGALPFGGGGSGGGSGKQDTEGVGKGRRMPVQQSVDVALPIETVYNQWTQFEDWPKFMHRVTRASQDDPCKVNFAVKIWGKTKEFTAEIETQRPDDRIKWKTTQGMNVTGVVAFRELAPNLTRIIVSFDVAPGGLIEKYARGARYVKRAARADMHRFVAFIEMLEHETGAWRGVIEDGELVEDHDPSYDEEREYADPDELVHGRGSEEDEDEDEDEEDDEASDEEDDDSEDEDKDEQRGRNGGEPQSRSRRSSNGRQSSGSRASSGSSSRAQRSSGSSSRSPSRSGSGSRSSSGSSGRSSSGRSSSGRSSSGSSRSSSGRSSGGSSRSSSGRSSSGSGRSSSGRSSSGSSGSSSGSGRSSGSSSGRSSSGRSSSGRSSGSSSGRSSSGRSSGSSSGRSSSGSSGSSSSSGGRTRSSSGSSRRSSSEHQGRQRSRSSRRS